MRPCSLLADSSLHLPHLLSPKPFSSGQEDPEQKPFLVDLAVGKDGR